MSLLSIMMQSSARQTFNIVFDGNSYVAGSGSTGGLNYPNQLKTLLQNAGKTVNILNFGVAGQTIDQMQSDAVSQIDTQATSYQFLIGTELINQWGLNVGQSKETIYAKYKQYFVDRKNAGFQKVFATTPIDQNYYARSGWAVAKQYFIDTMLAEFPTLGIGVINIGGDPRMSDWTNLTYYTSDKIHPNDSGYAVWAEIAYNSIINT